MMKNLSLQLFNNSELISICLVCILAVVLIIFSFKIFPFLRMRKNKCFAITLITILYAIISLWQLGSTNMPETWWQPSEDNETLVYKIEDSQPEFDAIYVIGGEGDNNALDGGYQVWFNNVEISGSNDTITWEPIVNFENQTSYLSWNVTQGDWDYQYIRINSKSKTTVINEIGLKKKGSDEFLKLSLFSESNTSNPYSGSALIDEQSIIPVNPTYYDSSYFDEIYHPRNAWEIANGQYMYATVHPLLGTTIMSLGIQVFGNNPFGWRIMGAIFGIMILPLFYLILNKLFKNKFLSTFGTVLFASDFMLITTSRIGTLEPFSVFFILLMTYFMILYFYTDFKTSFKTQLKYLALSGISMGLACSTKWTGCYAAIGLAILFFTHFIYQTFQYFKAKDKLDIHSQFIREQYKKRSLKIILWCCLFFVLVPLIIYALSYLPCNVWRNESWSINNVIKQTVGMYNYHANLEATHPYQSMWYQWIFDIQPIWYYFKSSPDGIVNTISCFNNPLISWMGIASILFTLVHSIIKKSKTGFIILVGYLVALVPWMAVTRCIFAYHYYPSIPFLIMAIVYAAKVLLDYDSKFKKLIIFFAIACIVVFILFLPVITGFTTTSFYITDVVKWLPTWYFGN